MKRTLRGSLTARIAAFFLLVISVWLTAACALGAWLMLDQEFYTRTENSLRSETFEGMARVDAYEIARQLVTDGDAAKPVEETNLRYEILNSEGEHLAGSTASSLSANAPWTYDVSLTGQSFESGQYEAAERYTVRVQVDEKLPLADRYHTVSRLLSLAYSLRYAVFVIGVAAFLLAAVCFVFLLCAAGRRAGERETPRKRLPFDLLTALLLGMTAITVNIPSIGNAPVAIALAAVAGTAAIVLGTLYCMNFVARVREGHWWRNTVIYWVLNLLWRGVKAAARGVAALVRALPLVWRTAVGWCALCLLTLILLMVYNDNGALALLWLLANLLLFPCVVYGAVMLRRLLRGSEALAAGDLAYQVDTSRMLWDMKRAGENLNSIAVGMSRAVEERLRSERMKTELITNVSHDIKTPLTSLINYADLIEREPTDNGKITEYAEVLHRQSERLKKLIDDLVEASKASSGNLEVLLAPCKVNVLLTQAAGEYQARLESAGLELVTLLPERTVKIMADGRRMWRVFENLMNNAAKYAMPGTRVYLSLEQQGGEALISLKNTSREPLNISAEELMERFVRGDAARASEGSGLGLSIARSLTELQGGKLELIVDGDLFKAMLRFSALG